MSFEEAAGHGDNDVDVAILHGIISWIEPSAQRAVVSILERRLRPNGVAFVSYNCMPGWSPLRPLRNLILEVKRRNPGSSEHQLALALDLIEKLWRGNAGYFVMNPMAEHHVRDMLRMDRAYLAHEYLNERAELPQFSDVAALLAPAGLSFVSSAALLDNFDAYGVPDTARPAVADIADPMLRETVRDFAANRKFRRDLYARGSEELSPEEWRRVLSGISFALAIPRARLMFKFLGPVGDITLRPEFHGAVADALAKGIAGFDRLLALPMFQARADLLVDCLALLIYSGQVVPTFAPDEPGVQPAQRFNRVLVERARGGRFYGHLASPLTGGGIQVDEFGLLTLAAQFDGQGDDPAVAANYALPIFSAAGRRPQRDKQPIENDGEALAFLADRIATVMREQVPVWRGLAAL
jgi:SAM-dependent methyltransferase